MMSEQVSNPHFTEPGLQESNLRTLHRQRRMTIEPVMRISHQTGECFLDTSGLSRGNRALMVCLLMKDQGAKDGEGRIESHEEMMSEDEHLEHPFSYTISGPDDQRLDGPSPHLYPPSSSPQEICGRYHSAGVFVNQEGCRSASSRSQDSPRLLPSGFLTPPRTEGPPLDRFLPPQLVFIRGGADGFDEELVVEGIPSPLVRRFEGPSALTSPLPCPFPAHGILASTDDSLSREALGSKPACRRAESESLHHHHLQTRLPRSLTVPEPERPLRHWFEELPEASLRVTDDRVIYDSLHHLPSQARIRLSIKRTASDETCSLSFAKRLRRTLGGGSREKSLDI